MEKFNQRCRVLRKRALTSTVNAGNQNEPGCATEAHSFRLIDRRLAAMTALLKAASRRSPSWGSCIQSIGADFRAFDGDVLGSLRLVDLMMVRCPVEDRWVISRLTVTCEPDFLAPMNTPAALPVLGIGCVFLCFLDFVVTIFILDSRETSRATSGFNSR